MKTLYLSLFGALALAATGCAGEFIMESGDNPADPDPDPTPSVDAGVDEPEPAATAQALYEANVRPVLLAACGSCHNNTDPAFVDSDAAASYAKIVGYRDRLFPDYAASGAALLLNGEGTHYGATYSQGDKDAITAWLSQEVLEANAGGGEPAASPLAIWSGCMNLEDWDEEGVAQAWSNKQANNQGNCEACHNLGADGFIASDQSLRVFEVITTNPSFMPSYFTLNAAGTNVVINRARLENVGNQLAPHEAHGGFDVDGNAMEALQRFYDKTVLRVQAGGAECEPPRF